MNTIDSTNVSRRSTNVMGADTSKNSKVSIYIIFLLWMVEKSNFAERNHVFRISSSLCMC